MYWEPREASKMVPKQAATFHLLGSLLALRSLLHHHHILFHLFFFLQADFLTLSRFSIPPGAKHKTCLSQTALRSNSLNLPFHATAGQVHSPAVGALTTCFSTQLLTVPKFCLGVSPWQSIHLNEMRLPSHSSLYFLLCSLSDLTQHRQISQADGNALLTPFFPLRYTWNNTHRAFTVATVTLFWVFWYLTLFWQSHISFQLSFYKIEIM